MVLSHAYGARSLSILDFRILALSGFQDQALLRQLLHQKVIFATKTNLLGIEGATLPCCRMKNHAARTGQLTLVH
jgi:hypothetical protein